METRKKILIVDVEQINVEFFDLMLSKLGFVVEKAANGRECLEKVKEFTPDLIMLDNIMPKMSGWEVTRILKNDPEYAEWHDVPIVMFSAMDDPATIGPSMVLALLTTLYGVILANLIAAPIAARLSDISAQELAWQRDLADRMVAIARRESAALRRASLRDVGSV